MNLSVEDRALIEIIQSYCDEITSAIAEFSITEKNLTTSSALRAMISFFVLQIGETANHLSPDFIKSHPEIEWRSIINFRHRIVHAYGQVIPEILWDTTQSDIPTLRSFCASLLS